MIDINKRPNIIAQEAVGEIHRVINKVIEDEEKLRDINYKKHQDDYEDALFDEIHETIKQEALRILKG